MSQSAPALTYRLYTCSKSAMEKNRQPVGLSVDRRRVKTADVGQKAPSKQVRLIATLRKLIIASAEVSKPITTSDKSLSVEAASLSKVWVCASLFELRADIAHT